MMLKGLERKANQFIRNRRDYILGTDERKLRKLNEYYTKNSVPIEKALADVAEFSFKNGDSELTDKIKEILWKLIPYQGNLEKQSRGRI